MRPKIVILILLPLFALLALVLLRPDKASGPDVAVSPTPPAVAPPEEMMPDEGPLPPQKNVVSSGTVGDPAGNAAPLPPKIPAADHEVMVEQRANELNELARQTNSEAHQKILDELKNSDHEIRLAAIEALKLANDRSVIPQMQQIADETDDLDEKVALRDAIEFIQLPTLTEYFKKGRGADAEK